jgi:hypothetical protein
MFYLLDQDGGNSLAGTTPGSEAVKHDNLVVLESLLPFVVTGAEGRAPLASFHQQ